MRQSGRTSRIIDFAIDQLFSVGEVIVADHTAFEFRTAGIKAAAALFWRIEERYKHHNKISGRSLIHTIEKSKGGINFIHIKIKIKTKVK